MKAPILTALLILVCAAEAQTVDYTAECTTLKQAFAEISKQTGKKFVAGADLAGEPVVLRLKAVPLQEVKDKLAQVFAADWVTSDKEILFTRTEATKERLLKARFDSMRTAWQSELDARAKGRQQTPNLDAATTKELVKDMGEYVANAKQGHGWNYIEEQHIMRRSAEGRLEDDILASIGAETLGGLPQGRHIFSNHPTAVQLPIEVSQSRLDQYVKEHNDLADSINSSMSLGSDNTQAASTIAGVLTPIQDNQLTVLLTVHADPQSNLVQFMFAFADKTGAYQYGDFQYISSADSNYKAREDGAILASSKSQPLKAPSVIAEIAKRERTSNLAKPLQPPSAEALAYLLHPEIHDPLEVGFAGDILTIAEAANENVVATAIDWAGQSALTANETGFIQVPYFEFLLEARPQEKIVEKDGWLLANPEDPLNASEQRLDREALATFLQSAAENGYSSIEDWGALAAASTVPSIGMPNTYRALLSGRRGSDNYVDWNAYRLFGLLDDDQRAKLANGGSVAFNTLDPDERLCLTKLLYESFDAGGLFVEHPTQASGTDPNDRRQTAGIGGLQGEPTVAVPNGIGLSSALRMSDTHTDQLYMTTEAGPDPSSGAMKDLPIDMNSFAFMLARQQRPDLYRDPPIKSVKLAQKRAVTFDLEVADNVVLEVSIDEEPKPGSESIPVDQLKDKLPPRIWARINAQMQGMLRSFKANPAEAPTTTPIQPPASG